MGTTKKPIDLKKAMLNPAAEFERPEDVLARADLSRTQKIDLLRRWEFDAREIQVAEEENMGAKEPSDTLDRVLRALHRLEAGPDLDHPAPTKHGGV